MESPSRPSSLGPASTAAAWPAPRFSVPAALSVLMAQTDAHAPTSGAGPRRFLWSGHGHRPHIRPGAGDCRLPSTCVPWCLSRSRTGWHSDSPTLLPMDEMGPDCPTPLASVAVSSWTGLSSLPMADLGIPASLRDSLGFWDAVWQAPRSSVLAALSASIAREPNAPTLGLVRTGLHRAARWRRWGGRA